MSEALATGAALVGHTLRVLLILAGWIRPLVGPAMVILALYLIWPPLSILAIGAALTYVDRRMR